MSDWAIRADSLGKLYHIGKQQKYGSFRESLSAAASAPWRAARAWSRGRSFVGNGKRDSFWALRDVGFEIRQGEVVGIIGRNGAGKSTLLKVLARITEPTTGAADIRGRVGSLLEVGTGFHFELTGRENIFLSGAILGMKCAEILRKFDQIVEFAGVERFLDTAVKHYSSGMYLRLAFAVAAHLEPEILMVDEVLAVGDATFQSKCLGRMEEVAGEGRTVLFVSHNMGAVRTLCNRGIYLENGSVAEVGAISGCIERYLRSVGALGDDRGESGQPGGTAFGPIRINGRTGNSTPNSQEMRVATHLQLREDVAGFDLFCVMKDMHGRQVFILQEISPDLGLRDVPPGRYEIEINLPPLWLVPGVYTLHFKAMLWGGFGSKYIRTDKFPIDFSGQRSPPNAEYCALQPEAQWSLRCSELTYEPAEAT